MTTATTPTITGLLLVYNSMNSSINYSAVLNVWPITYTAPELLL